MPTLDISELNRIYEEAESIDKDVFAEQRSNVLLVAGEHYTKSSQQFLNQVRTARALTETQKLRLTKNHQHKIVKYYTDTILSLSPDGSIRPRNDKERQDQKEADMQKSVYASLQDQLRLKEHYRNGAEDFTTLGEVASLIKWDYNQGRFLGYAQKVDEEGNPVFEVDEMGQPVMAADETQPMFSGKFEVERLYGFNLLLHSGSRDWRKPICFIVRKMVPNKKLLEDFAGVDKLESMIGQSGEDEYVVFDSQKAGYEKTRDHTLVKEYYWPPCFEYPEGYFAIATDRGKLAEDVLPGGIFPIVFGTFDNFQTARRGRSIIKVSRPYQAEINRASSQAAMHQITVGDDKILYQSGTKLQSGALLPGVRGLTYQGARPEILPGRAGMQFVDYIDSQIAEMYQAVNMEEILREKDASGIDPYALLYRSAKHKAHFSSYGEKFGQYIKDFMTTLLELAKFYLPDDELIPMIGKSEFVNIAEFRDATPLSHEIIIEPMDDTVDSMLGRQLTFNHILQYTGNTLEREDIGGMIANMPYGNFKDAFSDLTLDRDIVLNDILALERGELPKPGQYDDHKFMLKKLTKRTREPDFQYLDPQIQDNYAVKISAHEQVLAQQEAALLAAKNEYIPADGPLIACEMYVEDPDPTKQPKRARIPQRALSWLLDRLAEQGMTLQQMEGMNQGALTEMAQMMLANKPNVQSPRAVGPSLLQAG